MLPYGSCGAMLSKKKTDDNVYASCRQSVDRKIEMLRLGRMAMLFPERVPVVTLANPVKICYLAADYESFAKVHVGSSGTKKQVTRICGLLQDCK